MSRSTKIIRTEIGKIEAQVADLALGLQQVYGKYLELLLQSVQQQLIVATYQICTQAYPESFLSLSFNQRHALQNDIKQLTQDFQTQFRDYLGKSDSDGEVKKPTSDNHAEEQSSLLADSNQKQAEYPSNPEDLLKYYQKLEKGIHTGLESLSTEANRCLHKAGILPSRLPAKILEMALKTEENSSGSAENPNLLNLLVETEQEGQKEANITKITAIHLRLQEIEFAEPKLSSMRNQIRHLWEKLKQIRQQYQQKQRQLSILEAEAAWRSSWYDD